MTKDHARLGALAPFQIVCLVVALLAWELTVRSSASREFLPSPLGVWRSAVQHVSDGSLLSATSGSLSRVVAGFLFASLLGVGVGLAMGFLPIIRRALMPIVESMRAIAPIAWIPLAVVWFGISGSASIFVVAYAAFFPFVVNTVHGIAFLDRRLVDAARSLGASRARVIGSVVLPAIVPIVILAARISMGFAWGSIIAAEMAMGVKLSGGSVASEGLGQLMIRTLYVKRDIDALVLFLITIGIVALIVDSVFRAMGRRLAPWTSAM